MNAADRRRVTPVLAILGAALVVLFVVFWAGIGRGAHWHDSDAPPRLPPVGATLPPPTVPPLEKYSDVWERPLFSPTRTPEAVGGQQTPSGDLELTGVVILPGLKMAILHDKTSGKDYRVIEGRRPEEGPSLLELHPRSAVIDASGSHLQLQLVPGPSPDAGNAPAAANATFEGSAPGGASAIQSGLPVSIQASAEARARALKARIEAQRRRAQRDGGR